ncbi:VWA domain-containing protein [Wukongibacter baidiensis]|uniref:VWA domain-containing protein n=1 Tax=Wukongibacter baidiensis TaxID=1723361 RepID=UPI003D7FBAE2
MRGRQRYFKIGSMLLVITIIISSIIVPNSYADSITKNVKAPINLVKEVEKNQYLVNEEIVINYMIQPQPIPVEDIVPESYLKDKEIVLVMDTSGSMNRDLNGSSTYNTEDKRMTIAKNAAKLFINKLKEDDRVSSSLVSYSNTANLNNINGKNFVKLANSNEFTEFEVAINGLSANGGTNIGDGLRRAYYLLDELDDDQKRKYIILMTDGDPTAFTYDRIAGQFYSNYYNGTYWYEDYYGQWHQAIGQKKEGSTTSPVFWINSVDYRTSSATHTKYYVNWSSTGDYNGLSQNYANTISQMITDDDSEINTFIVGFSNDVNKDKLQQIADSSSGFYKEAKTAEDIIEVYEKLAEQIQSDLPIHGIRFQETFPEGMEVVEVSEGLDINNQIVTGDIGSISYILNEETNQFEAEPFEFFIKLRGNTAGDYNLGKDSSDNNTSYIDYKDIDGTDGQKSFPRIDISVYEKEPPQVSGYLTDHEDDGEKYSLALTIDEPAEIVISNTEGDILWSKDERDEFSEYQSDKTFNINIAKSDIDAMFVNMKATDVYENFVTETVPLVRLNPIEIQDDTKTPDGIKGSLSLETEENTTITSMKINGEIAATDRLTDDGNYTQLIDLIYGENEIEISVKNGYSNRSTLKFGGITVEGPPAPPDINIKVSDGEGLRDTYEILSDTSDVRVKKILTPNIVLKGDAFADINVMGEEVNFFKYQFMNTSIEPQDMPEDGWLSLDLNEETVNEDVVLEKQGYLNQRAYDVSHMPTLSGTDKWSNPQEVFKVPFEATYHKSASFSTSAAEYGDWEDYKKVDGTSAKRWVTNSIFMKNMNVTGANGNTNANYKEASKFWGYIKVPVDGDYKFGANSDDGSKGYITVEGETKSFVNMFKPQGSRFGTTNEVFHLKANKFYPIYLEYFNWGGWAHFEMKYSNNGNTPSTRVPAEWFYPSKNITPGEYDKTIFTGSEGVKFPTESGDYYILFKTGEDGEVTREGIYGPFTVDAGVSLNLSKEVIGGSTVQEKDIFKLKYTVQPEEIKTTSTYKNENGVYNESISLTNVLLQDEYPANIDIDPNSSDDVVVNGQAIKVNMENIEYQLTGNVGEQVYVANPVSFVVDLSTNTPGSYTLSEFGKSIISFTDINDAKSQMEFPSVTVEVRNKNSAVLNFDRSIDKSSAYLKEPFELSYEIKPQSISALSGVGNLPDKEVIKAIVFSETIPDGIVIETDNLPSGVTVVGQDLTYFVDSITYSLNDAKTTYEPDVDSLSFAIDGYGKVAGNFKLGQDAELSFEDIDGSPLVVPLGDAGRIDIEITGLPAPIIEADEEWTNAEKVPVKISTNMVDTSGITIQYKLIDVASDEGEEILGWTDYDQIFDVIREGETKIVAKLIDDNGNSSEEVSKTVKIDRTPPPIRIDTPIMGDDIISESEKDDVTIEGDTGTEADIKVKVVISDEEDGKVSKTTYSDSDGNFQIDGFDVRELADGKLTITATATDDVGNSNSDTEVVNDLLLIENENITDAKDMSESDIIKNGKLIVKVKFTLQKTLDTVRIRLVLQRDPADTDGKFETGFEKIKLEINGEEHTDWDINDGTIEINSISKESNCEALLEFDVIKDDKAEAGKTKYKIMIDEFEGIKSGESDTYNPDPDPTLQINVVEEPNIL